MPDYMSRLLSMLQDAAITNEVVRAARGEKVRLSDDTLGFLKQKFADVSRFTASDVTRALGLSIFEAHRLIRRLCNQAALSPSVSLIKRNGAEWSYAWA